MTEHDDKSYHAACAALFAAIEERLDDSDADYDNNGNVLEITTESGEKIIINKQAPMREVWLAERGGGRHYRLADGVWQDTKGGAPLLELLDELLG